MEILPSASKHGVTEEDIRHAIAHSLTVDEVGDDPMRILILGPDLAGNVLEPIVLDRKIGPAVIHAMPMRAVYRKLLEGGR